MAIVLLKKQHEEEVDEVFRSFEKSIRASEANNYEYQMPQWRRSVDVVENSDGVVASD